MRLRSGKITRRNRRRQYTNAQLMRMYPLFDYPVPRRRRKPDRSRKAVKVKPHTRRLPLGQPVN